MVVSQGLEVMYRAGVMYLVRAREVIQSVVHLLSQQRRDAVVSQGLG